MTTRAKCDKCKKRKWKRIAAGKGYCGPCLIDREAEKVQRAEVRNWRRQ